MRKRRALGSGWSLAQQLSLIFPCCLLLLALWSLTSAVADVPPPPPPLEGPVLKSTDSGSTWVSINNGLSAKTVYTLAADTNSPSTIYAGTERGVFKTTDAGNRWIQSTGPITLFIVDRLAVDAVSPTTVYAGGVSFAGASVFKSNDAGLNWRPINRGLEGLQIYSLLIDPVNRATLYANDDYNLYKSTNGGKKWGSVLSYLPTGGTVFDSQLEMDPFNASTLYIMGDGHIYKTTDGGRRWIDITDRLAPVSGTESFIDLSVDPINQSVVYAQGFGPSRGPVKTTDGGNTWELATDVNSFLLARVVSYSAARSVLYSTDSFSLLFKSTDQGNRWSEGVLPRPPWAFALDASNSSILYLGTDGGKPLMGPWIRGFSLVGKRLLVIGGPFDDGAVILLDGEEQSTENDPEVPSQILVGKKAGKKILKHPDTKIQVRNANGGLSQEVTIWPPID